VGGRVSGVGHDRVRRTSSARHPRQTKPARGGLPQRYALPVAASHLAVSPFSLYSSHLYDIACHRLLPFGYLYIFNVYRHCLYTHYRYLRMP
jgi:hypothetical protein